MAEKIHLIAACGTGMGTLACLLKEKGYDVSGSDRNVYPPMSDFLRENGISLFDGYDDSNLDHDPDLVIIGNAVSKDNVEADAVIKKGIPYLSMPEAVNRFIAHDKKIILVTGTHGKTTTSSILAHLLYTAGMDPSFMVGGILRDFNSSFRIGSGEYMIIEGDEYDTAFFDKGPKFMHYPPEIAIITGIEFDHADIFSGIDQIKGVFKAFVLKNADKSHFITFGGNVNLNEVIDQCRDRIQKPVDIYGEGGAWHFSPLGQKNHLTCCDLLGPGTTLSIETPLVGEHNMLNCTACVAAAKKIGIRDETIRKALASFSGVKRRQEIRGCKNGVTVMDDFAHHPTAVKETIAAVRPFYKKGRVIAVFEPRTNTSMRNLFQAAYPDAFLEADVICICRPQVKKAIPEEERFSTLKLVEDLKMKGKDAYHFDQSGQVLDFLKPYLRENDLVLIMSNGGFDNIHTRLLEMIE